MQKSKFKEMHKIYALIDGYIFKEINCTISLTRLADQNDEVSIGEDDQPRVDMD